MSTVANTVAQRPAETTTGVSAAVVATLVATTHLSTGLSTALVVVVGALPGCLTAIVRATRSTAAGDLLISLTPWVHDRQRITLPGRSRPFARFPATFGRTSA
jgi:hypothetical protein